MSNFVQNSTQFAADCAQDNGLCIITPENFLFLDDGKEDAAIDHLQMECGKIVLIPDAVNKGQTFLYHMSCDRITDVVNQIFQDALEESVSIAQADAEQTLGELCRWRVAMPCDECKLKVEGFSF
jgi:hypothetical protein